MIENFSGKYSFLSNFYDVDIIYEDIVYHSTEAAFQAAKTLDVEKRKEIATMNPSKAKRMGRTLKLREDWEEIKDKVMYDVCFAKFATNNSLHLKERLLETGSEELIEGNTWHDNYWGNCVCDKCINITGKNQLGKTLMKIRSELKQIDELIEKLNDELIEKLNKEFEAYEDKTLKLQPIEIFDRSYETAIKAEIICLIEENTNKLSGKLINRLLECGNTLEFLYDTYMGDDSANIINELATVIENLEFKIKFLEL